MHSIRPAIVTTYHGPTDRNGSRVTASANGRRCTTAWDHAVDSEENHRRAAERLACNFDTPSGRNWLDDAELVGAQIEAGRYAWVIVEKSYP